MELTDLFKKFARKGMSAEELIEALSGRQLAKSLSSTKLKEALTAYRKLGAERRAQIVSDFVEHMPEIPEPPAHPLFQVFSYGEARETTCEAMPGQYTLVDGKWKSRSPLVLKEVVPCYTDTLDFSFSHLIKLAQGLKRAFKVNVNDISEIPYFGHVFMGKGNGALRGVFERKENGLVAKIHEVENLYGNVALLFEATSPEENGFIAVHTREGEKTSYGLSVWGVFYAVEFVFDESGFEVSPKI